MYQSADKCPKCGHPNLRGSWVCSKCGTTLQIYCSNCRANNAMGSQFCQSCGMPLGAGAQMGGQPPPVQAQQPYHPAPQQAYPAAQPYQQPGQNQQYETYQQNPPQNDPYQQNPPQYDGYWQVDSRYPAYGSWQDKLNRFAESIKDFIRTTNPILLSALVIGAVGMIIFLVLAFQLGWIKTDDVSTDTITATDKTGPQLSLIQLKDGAVKNSVIVSWITDEYSSSRVNYGPFPYRSNWTLIQNDPQTGTNKGVLVHEVGITNLIGGSTYVYCVESIDKYGNVTLGPEMQFQTSKSN